MHHVNLLAILVAALVAFVLSSVWYVIFAKARAALSPAAASETGRPPEWKMAAEVGRSLVVATVIAMFMAHLGVGTGAGSIPFALLLWIGFPVIILTGSVIYENVPVKLAAIHAGDWLVKLVVISLILGFWR